MSAKNPLARQQRRDDFPIAIVRILAARSGHHCSNPACLAATSGPSEDESRVSNLGVAAHITAAASEGPRYDPALTPEQRKAEDNGIWLCQSCGKKVDANTSVHTTTELKGWKYAAETRATVNLCLPASAKEYTLGLGDQTLYVNVQRFIESAVKEGIPVRDIRATANSTLLSIAGQLAFYVIELEKALARVRPAAIPFHRLDSLQAIQLSVGALVSFEGTFRTKNSPPVINGGIIERPPTGDHETDHHLYKTYGDVTLVLPLDYRWTASNSATGFFRNGWVRVKGIARLHKLCNNIVYASPVWIALPGNRYMNAMDGNFNL